MSTDGFTMLVRVGRFGEGGEGDRGKKNVFFSPVQVVSGIVETGTGTNFRLASLSVDRYTDRLPLCYSFFGFFCQCFRTRTSQLI